MPIQYKFSNKTRISARN